MEFDGCSIFGSLLSCVWLDRQKTVVPISLQSFGGHLNCIMTYLEWPLRLDSFRSRTVLTLLFLSTNSIQSYIAGLVFALLLSSFVVALMCCVRKLELLWRDTRIVFSLTACDLTLSLLFKTQHTVLHRQVSLCFVAFLFWCRFDVLRQKTRVALTRQANRLFTYGMWSNTIVALQNAAYSPTSPG